MVGRKGLVFFLVLSLACITFVGCASVVPKAELDEKDAAIKNLNTQIDSLKEDVARLERSNEGLMSAKSDLEQKLTAAESKKAETQKPSEETTEKVK